MFSFSLTRITPVLADSAFHLFIQSSLTVKEMESFISGIDKRDLLDIIDPESAAEYRENKDRRCTCHSTGDSGFSGSVQPDDVEETRRTFDGKSYFALLVIGLEMIIALFTSIMMKKYHPHKAFPTACFT